MQENPKVSILVPAYNAEKTISRCLESILKQTWTDFELVVIDDGSSDDTAHIIDEFVEADPRVSAVHKENSGVSDTRNTGLSLAKGEYVQFLDADDWITPDATRLLVRAMEESDECDMVIADFYRVIDRRMSQKGDIDAEGIISRNEYAEYMMRNPADFYYGVLWNKLFKREIIEENAIRMDENLDWSEDFIFNLEYILHADSIYVLKVPVYYYVKTKGSLIYQGGSSIAKVVQMKLDVIEYYSDFYKNIYPAGSYLHRRPAIYSFLLNFAKDGSVNPVNADRRIGESRINVNFSEEHRDNIFVLSFYDDRMLESALNRIMKGNEVEENEALVLLYLELSGGFSSTTAICNFTGLSSRIVNGCVQKLVRKDVLKRIRSEKKGSDTFIAFDGKSGKIRESINRAFRDIEDIQLRNFTGEEKEQYARLRRKAADNIRLALDEPVPENEQGSGRKSSKNTVEF